MQLELQKGSRSKILGVGLALIIAIFIARLFYLQIIRHDYYTALASEEQLKSRIIPAQRGQIYALDNGKAVPLVLNETVYTVFADPPTVSDKDQVVKAVNEIAGGNTRSNFADLLDKKDSRYQILATKLSRTQANKLKQRNLAGIGFQTENQRVYPEGALAAQTLGFVNAEGTGNYGVEGGLDDRLRGQDGLQKTVTDVRDVPLTIGDQNVSIPAQNGENIVLTLDRNIQSYVESALKNGLDKAGATKGSAIVMNPNNGQVLAMANLPTYNPTEFGKVSDGALFNNAIISEPIEPGSVMKTFMLGMAIDKGAITPESTYVNQGFIKVEDRVINNAYRGLLGTINMQDVLNNSLNTGTVTAAQRLGGGSISRTARDTMYHYYHDKFRLGQLSNIELANESAGTIVSPDEQEGNAVRYATMSFGQGMNLTMLQVSAGFCSLINGGQYYRPTVVAGTLKDGKITKSQPQIVGRTVSEQTSQTITQMTLKARQSMAYMKNADRSGYQIGGKTGTSETLQNGSYSKAETVGVYLGFGGGERSEYVIMVQVAAPGKALEGGLHASPIFTDISNWLIDYMKIAPKE